MTRLLPLLATALLVLAVTACGDDRSDLGAPSTTEVLDIEETDAATAEAEKTDATTAEAEDADPDPLDAASAGGEVDPQPEADETGGWNLSCASAGIIEPC